MCWAFVLQLGCGQADRPEKSFGPNEMTDLVIVFNKTTTNEDINEFEKNVIGKPHDSGVGFISLEGIGNGYRLKTGGFEMEGINFKTDATAEQKNNVKQRVLSSSLVRQVFENVNPKQIRISPDE